MSYLFMVAVVSNVMACTNKLLIWPKNGHTLIELSGVEPNPRIETVRKGIELCKENQVDVILAVGGGSTIDCSKAIAAGFIRKKISGQSLQPEKGIQVLLYQS